MRLTLQVQVTLRALLAEPDQELYGLELVDATGLPPGTIYPIMARLEEAGWVSSRWEEIDQHLEGRPRRRYYRLSSEGVEQARSALAVGEERRQARARRAGGEAGLAGGARPAVAG